MRERDLRVHSYIVEAIRSGEYSSGDRLPTERAFGDRLGVPRSVVRTALAALENEGLVRRRIGSGTYVASRSVSPAKPADISPAQIMDARFMLEPRLAHLASVNATTADLALLEQLCERGEGADDLDAFEQADAALHQAIAEATHNSLVVALYSMITNARDVAEWGDLKRRSLTAARRDTYRSQHRSIVEELRKRRADDAEAALLKHLQHVRANLLGL